MANGVCKLTGIRGRYVKSHLIPKALTYPGPEGPPFYQGGSGRFSTRRWDSWYDPKLVVAEGETILADLDDWAVKFLRKQHLVWSGWGPMQTLAPSQKLPFGDGWGLRQIEVENPTRLRLFFHSLLWRAAASGLPEFAEIAVSVKDLELLRTIVAEGVPAPVSFYPITLTQLSTRGDVHNLSPISQEKPVPGIDDQRDRLIPIFRFYFDGLIAHFHRHAKDDGYTASLGAIMVGLEKTLRVVTLPYEGSFQQENLNIVIAETRYR